MNTIVIDSAHKSLKRDLYKEPRGKKSDIQVQSPASVKRPKIASK